MRKRFLQLFAFALITCAIPVLAYAATTAEYEVTMYLIAHDGSMLNGATQIVNVHYGVDFE